MLMEEQPLSSWTQVETEIKDFLLFELGIQDQEPFQDYLLQLLHPQEEVWGQDEQEDEEIYSIVTEFLIEACSDDGHTEKINKFVSQLLEWKNTLKENEEEVEEVQLVQSLEKVQLDGGVKVDPSLQSLLVETRTSQKKQVSRQERVDRERMLAQYGYELEESLEMDGETEIVFKAREKNTDPPLVSLSQSNADFVKEKSRKQKMELKEKHEKEKQRNKELLEKQKIEKELKKKGTQKKEKKRG